MPTLLHESTGEKHLDEPDTITVSPPGGVLVREDGNGEDEAGGDNYLRILRPAGKLETFARNDTPLDLHRWEEDKPGVMGRSEYSGSCYRPDGQWLFVHMQYPEADLGDHRAVGEELGVALRGVTLPGQGRSTQAEGHRLLG